LSLTIQAQPNQRHLGVVGECELRWTALKLCTHPRQFTSEPAIATVDFGAAGKPTTFRRSDEPVADCSYSSLRSAVIGVDILTRDIRQESPISVWVSVQDETILKTLRLAAESLATQVESEFEWHVEPGQPRAWIDTNGGKVVDPVWALRNDGRDFVNPDLTSIFDLQCTPGNEPKVVNREHHSFKDGPMALVIRAVDEHVR